MTWCFAPPFPIHVLDDSCEASVPPGTESLLIPPGLSWVPFPSWFTESWPGILHFGTCPVFHEYCCVSLWSIGWWAPWVQPLSHSLSINFSSQSCCAHKVCCPKKCIVNFISLGNRAAALIAQEYLPTESQNWRETPCIPIHRCGNWGPRRDKFHATPGLTWDPHTVQDVSADRRPSLTLPSADTDPWPTGSSS